MHMRYKTVQIEYLPIVAATLLDHAAGTVLIPADSLPEGQSASDGDSSVGA
jgi:hypothetical protein